MWGIDEVFAQQTGSGVNAKALNYFTDALGSTILLTDRNGSVVADYLYDPYGNTMAGGMPGINNPFQYTGRENDNTGLYYYRARYYSPAMQRFISEDPIGLRGGINAYGYVLNDPINWIDPLGLARGSVGVSGGAHGAIAGGGMGAGVSADSRGTVCVYLDFYVTLGIGVYAGGGVSVSGGSGYNRTGISQPGGIFGVGGAGIVGGGEGYANNANDINGGFGAGAGFLGVGVGGAGGFKAGYSFQYCFNEPEEPCK